LWEIIRNARRALVSNLIAQRAALGEALVLLMLKRVPDMKKQLFRCSLFVAAGAGFVCIIVTQLHIRPLMNRLLTERDEARSTVSRLSQRTREVDMKLREKDKALMKMRAAFEEQARQQRDLETSAQNLSQALDRATLKAQTAERELARWQAIGIPAEQVLALSTQNRELLTRTAKLEVERKELQRENARLKLSSIPDVPDEEPQLPPLKGSVLVVDPKWNFVVLDLGEDTGIRHRGVLMVTRGGKLIAKVRVSRVESDRSIADVLPGWKLAELREGDQVFN
jgi:hypothetical protein